MKKYVPKFATTSFVLFALSVIVYSLALDSRTLADGINATVCAGLRSILSSLTFFLPFSLFELIIILAPIAFITLIILAFRSSTDRSKKVRVAFSLLGVISLILTSYLFTLGIGYHTTTLSERTGIEDREDITGEELFATALIVIDELNSLAEEIELSDGETRMPYSMTEMSEKLVSAYDTMNAEFSLLTNYPSRVKPVYFSTVMSDLGISGIYSFFTGEANVNVEYPDYCVPFTSAHEMAHQRGICRENEASFVAFLVCISSDDAYIRYSGYLNLYEYLASAIYSFDPDLYYDLRSHVHSTAIADMRAASLVYNEHKDSVLGKINEKLNDAYLKANGTEGVVSYGYVVRLAVGYYEKVNNK